MGEHAGAVLTPSLIALFAFLLVQLAIGVWISRRIASETDYLLAGRSLGYTLATFSVFATWFGAETIIGSAGAVYSDGLSIASAEPFAYSLCLLAMGAFIAKPLWDRQLTTLADLYRQRFDGRVERLAAILLIPGSVLWAAAQVRAFGQVISTVGELDVSLAITIGALFTVAYTMFGGLLADAVTDVLQGGLLALGLVVILTAMVLHVGGANEAVALLSESERISIRPPGGDAWYLTLEAWAIPVFGSLMATEVVGRVIATRTGTVAQRSTIAAGVLYLVIGSIPVVVALLARPLVGELADAETLMPTVARELLSPVLFAIFAGGLVSAVLSTVDSTLLVASGLLSHNILLPAFGITDDRTKVRLARVGVLLFGVIAYMLALNADGVYALVEQASAFGSAGVLVTALFALFTPWGSARTAIATLLAGVTVYVGAVALGAETPFLASLGASLLTWGLGCSIDYAAS